MRELDRMHVKQRLSKYSLSVRMLPTPQFTPQLLKRNCRVVRVAIKLLLIRNFE